MKPAVLVTTDLSPDAASALPFARRVADGLGLPTEVLHIVHAPVLAPALTQAPELDARDAETALRKTIDATDPDSPVRIEVRIATDVVAAILDRAKEIEAPFLVVAASGKTGWQRLRLGSTVHALLRHLALPLVCVPANRSAEKSTTDTDADAERTSGNGVLVTCDLSPLSRRALAPGAALARALGGPLTLVAVTSGPASEAEAWGRALRGLATDLTATGVDARAEVIQADDVTKAIVDRAAAPDIAMLCMASHGHGGLKRMLLGSVVEAVLPRVRVPLAVIPAA